MDYKIFYDNINAMYDLIDLEEDDEIDKFEFDDFYNLFIEVDKENNTFNIYVEFTHPLYDTEEYEHEGDIEIYYADYFKNILKEKFLSEPEEILGEYLGAPFDNQKIGYFDIAFDSNFVKKFTEAYKYWQQQINDVETEELDGEIILKNLIDAKWATIKRDTINKGYISENYWIKRHDNRIILTTKNFLENFSVYFNIDDLVEIEKMQYGTRFVLFKIEKNHFVAVERLIYDEVINIAQSVGEEFDIHLYIKNEEVMYFSTQSLVGIVMLFDNIDFARTLEYNYFTEAFSTFKEFAPPEKVKHISFKHLNDELFENLSMDFLYCKGYFDIHPLGRTRASDGGKDFFAKRKNYTSVNNNLIEQWIVQCKYSNSEKRKSFKREMFSEIPDLLGENYSDKYLLLTTADLSPKAVERINYLNRKYNDIIVYYAVNELKLALCSYPQLIHKYNLIEDNE